MEVQNQMLYVSLEFLWKQEKWGSRQQTINSLTTSWWFENKLDDTDFQQPLLFSRLPLIHPLLLDLQHIQSLLIILEQPRLVFLDYSSKAQNLIFFFQGDVSCFSNNRPYLCHPAACHVSKLEIRKITWISDICYKTFISEK